ncbi:uncharacterized protein LOC125940722 [Dermacentor silvarum]|uniref:uncharacterized protein LOC125940722 n=1 Tax=Dermacentor silvarum TaxID=543639 RepID=UPI0021010888|nr:uncharacterized protein LOC125940722 [Dermacentor silvarum]
MGTGGPRCNSGGIGMKFTFVLALSCGTLLAASYAQEEENDEMGKARRRRVDVVGNIMAVIRKLADLVVPEQDARETLHEHLETVTTCLRKADGLQLNYIRQFIAGIPRALDCVGMVFSARNKRQQNKASKCFIRRLIQFQKQNRIPMDQIKKVGDSITCLKENFLM